MSELLLTTTEVVGIVLLAVGIGLLVAWARPERQKTTEPPDSDPLVGGTEVYRRGVYSVRHLAGWYWTCQDCLDSGVMPLDRWLTRESAVTDVRNRWIHRNSTTAGG